MGETIGMKILSMLFDSLQGKTVTFDEATIKKLCNEWIPILDAFLSLRSVASSNIHAVGYSSDKLLVEFNGGGLYLYDEVPAEVFNQLNEADSKGKFLNSKIKGSYNYRKLV